MSFAPNEPFPWMGYGPDDQDERCPLHADEPDELCVACGVDGPLPVPYRAVAARPERAVRRVPS